MTPNTKYLLVVQHVIATAVSAVAELRKTPEFANLEIVLLTAQPQRYEKFAGGEVPLHIVPCDYASDAAITEGIAPYRDRIVGVQCRGDRHIQYLRQVSPLLPSSVPVASAEALAIATDKRRMRAAFQAKYPEITPQYMQVDDAGEPTIAQVAEKLGYPVIIKPANLASSMLIQSCHTEAELRSNLNQALSQLDGLYKREGRSEKPQLIVEQYMEGEFYSVDAYIINPGEVYFCPPIGYVPAKQIGIDDFFLYKRFAPSGLDDAQTEACNVATAKSLDAVGLTHSSAHVELVLTKQGWKIIEIGPRLGRFRHQMYQIAYGIDHSLNDVKIHLGLQPEIPSELQAYCTAYSIYPDHEGILRGIAGLDELQKLPEVSGFKQYANPGDKCVFAKHGGGALAQFVISSSDEAAFAKLTEWVEHAVHADID